ncbi:MAG TPA: DegT/DnrJ/EryC1/StrS family aminotransferase [Solirubrobacteraceae bacterium]|nr:DegT/DnrJ/EryC1/StrS family aminotransferase [Solirubrobacteraceae bacterium]
MPVPLFDTETPLAPLRETILERVSAVIDGGRFILGPEVQDFEQELGAYIGVGHAIGVGNGTDAITIAARALGVEPGDEVVVPSFTFYATAEAIAAMGAIPVFCDVDRDTRNVTAETIRPALTPKTKAIIAVDLFGMPAEIEPIRDAFGLPVIEDAAQALGASLRGRRAGALGDIATFSFYPSKNLGAFGDGGAITTDDDDLAERVRALRFHGSRDKQSFQFVGYNSRLDEIQAAILRVLLPRLDAWCDGRRAGAQAYIDAGLGDHLELGGAPLGATPAWHLYVATHSDADAKLKLLNDAGIQARAYYRTPLHRQPAMAPYVARDGRALELPVTDELARTNLALPISPVFTRVQADEVVAALAAA